MFQATDCNLDPCDPHVFLVKFTKTCPYLVWVQVIQKKPVKKGKVILSERCPYLYIDMNWCIGLELLLLVIGLIIESEHPSLDLDIAFLFHRIKRTHKCIFIYKYISFFFAMQSTNQHYFNKTHREDSCNYRENESWNGPEAVKQVRWYDVLHNYTTKEDTR